MLRRKLKISLAFLIIFFPFQSAFADISFAKGKNNPEIDYWFPVTETIYRGAQPSEENLRELKKFGIKTIVSFRTSKKKSAWEKKQAESLGMNYVHIPWRIYYSKDPRPIHEFLKVIDDQAAHPVFFHCRHGRDRTGVMSALLFMKEGFSKEEAKKKSFSQVSPHLKWRYWVNKKNNQWAEFVS